MIDLWRFEAAALRKMLRVGNGAEWLSCILPMIGTWKRVPPFSLMHELAHGSLVLLVNLTSPCAASILNQTRTFSYPVF